MDDTYLVISAANTLTSPAELAHIEAWAGIVTEIRLPSQCNSQTYLVPTVCRLGSAFALQRTEPDSIHFYEGAWNSVTIPPVTQTLLSIAEEVEYDLFTTILRNPQHVLQPYLQERPQPHYHLRNRLGLSKSLIQKTVDLNSSPATCIKLVTEPTRYW